MQKKNEKILPTSKQARDNYTNNINHNGRKFATTKKLLRIYFIVSLASVYRSAASNHLLATHKNATDARCKWKKKIRCAKHSKQIMSLHPRIYLYLIHSAFGIDAGNESYQIMIHSHSCMSGFYFLVDFNRMRTRFRQCNENPITLLLFFILCWRSIGLIECTQSS